MKKLAALAAVVLATTGLATVTSPAQAAPASLVSTYVCDSQFGGGPTDVALRGSLPAQVKAGKQVAARTVRFAVVIPENLVDGLRDFGVRSLSGQATGAKVRVGSTKVAVSSIGLPSTAVPSSGPMVLSGTGRLSAFTLRKAGTFAVRIPVAFDARVVARTSSGSMALDLGCGVQAGAPTKLGAVKVVR